MRVSDIFFRRNRRKDYPTPPWMYVLIGIFCIYSFIQYSKQETKPGKDLNEVVEKARKTVNAETVTNTYEDFKKLLFPSYSAALNINDLKLGEGMPAVCGQEVTIAYESAIVAGESIDDRASKDEPKKFRIGEGEIIPALEHGVVGMSPGGVREIISTLKMSYGVKKFAHAEDEFPANARIRFEVALLSNTPPIPDPSNTPFRITNIVDPLRGSPVMCGEVVKLHVTLWSVAGKKLYSSHDGTNTPISFTLGASKVFMGLEQGVIGMTRSGARTLIVPPDYQKTMRGNEPEITFPFPEAQTVLVDVEAIP